MLAVDMIFLHGQSEGHVIGARNQICETISTTSIGESCRNNLVTAVEQSYRNAADTSCTVILLTVMVEVFPDEVAEGGRSPEACVGGHVAAAVSDGHNCLPVNRIAVGGVAADVAQGGLVISRCAEGNRVGACNKVGEGVLSAGVGCSRHGS